MLNQGARFLLLTSLLATLGCHNAHAPATTNLTLAGLNPQQNATLDALCTPPLGWKPDPLKQSPTHQHQVWLSPSGHTAYGVIHFHLPWPVGHDLALWGFLNQMKASEGEGTLLEKKWDPNLNGVRFVAEGGQYTVRANLFVHGFTGWAIYAGTLRAFPVDQDELKLAERARECTVVDLP